MDSRKRRLFQIFQLVFLGIIAFSTGGILIWLLLSSHAQRPNETWKTIGGPLTVKAPAAPATRDSVLDPVPEHQLAQEPDVSRMSPQIAAATLGNWSFDNKLWLQAITQYEKAILLGLDNPDIRTDLGTAYRFSGQLDHALEQYSVANRQDPQHENSLFNLASLYLENLNQPAKAAQLLEEFQKRFPQSEALPRVHQMLEQAKR